MIDLLLLVKSVFHQDTRRFQLRSSEKRNERNNPIKKIHNSWKVDARMVRGFLQDNWSRSICYNEMYIVRKYITG